MTRIRLNVRVIREYALFSTHEIRSQCVTPLSFVLFFLGVMWISLLGTICVTTGELKPRGTYVSDNGIMPGTAITEVSAQDLNEAFTVLHSSNGSTTAFGHLERLGVEGLNGGILRSTVAADRREAICLVAQKDRGDDVLLALSKSLQRAKWLSKDVVFLVLPREQLSRQKESTVLRSYLESYALDNANDLLSRAGPIRGAVIVDLPSEGGRASEPPLNREALLVQGMNGRLPNMDLINTARITVPTFAAGRQSFFELPEDDPPGEPKTKKGLRFARDVLLGPTGWHGEFLRMGIDAITIKASVVIPPLPPTTSNNAISAASRIAGGTRGEYAQRIEKMVRSLSNMSEKFNRSFYFYLMLGIESFVSIDEFLWALIIFISPLAIDAFYVALAPSRNGFGEVRMALGTLGAAISSGFALMVFADSSLKGLSLTAIWIGLLLGFAAWGRLTAHKEDTEAEFGSWRYRKAANEVYIFIICSALGVVHFPLAICAAGLCLFQARLSGPLFKSKGASVVTSCTSLALLVGLSTVLLTQQYMPIESLLLERKHDFSTIVLFLLVLPSHLLTASVLLI